jgi:hypothetical protein
LNFRPGHSVESIRYPTTAELPVLKGIEQSTGHFDAKYAGYLRRQMTTPSCGIATRASIGQIVRQTGHNGKLVRDVLRGQRANVFRTRPSSLETWLPWFSSRWEHRAQSASALKLKHAVLSKSVAKYEIASLIARHSPPPASIWSSALSFTGTPSISVVPPAICANRAGIFLMNCLSASRRLTGNTST